MQAAESVAKESTDRCTRKTQWPSQAIGSQRENTACYTHTSCSHLAGVPTEVGQSDAGSAKRSETRRERSAEGEGPQRRDLGLH